MSQGNKAADWQEFEVDDYLKSNYDTLLEVDLQVMRSLVDIYQQVGATGLHGIEISCGPNLYPVLAALPHLSSVVLTDYAQPFLDYLERQKVRPDVHYWQRFVDYLALSNPSGDSEHVGWENAFTEKVIEIRKHDLLVGPVEGEFEIASMQFVAESMTDDLGEFETAVGNFCRSVRAGGFLVSTYILRSQPHNCGATYKPKVISIEPEQVTDIINGFADISVSEIHASDPSWRAGYSGTLTVLATRHG